MRNYNSTLTNKLDNLILVSKTQVDMSYINPLCAQVFTDAVTYAPLQNSIESINMIGSSIWSYLGEDDAVIALSRYLELAAGLTNTKTQITDLKVAIDECALNCGVGQELSDCLDHLASHLTAIETVIDPIVNPT